MRNLTQSEFMTLIEGIYRVLMNGIERIKAQGQIMSELLESLK